MLNITKKAVRTNIKRGLGFDQFCEKFDCTREEFECAINNIYGRCGAATALKDIQDNTKRIQKAMRKTRKPKSEMQALEELHLTPLEECPNSTSCSIDNLRQQEATLSKTVIGLESEHKELFNRHRANVKHLCQFRTQLDELRRQFQSISQEYETLATQNNELVLQLSTVTEKHRSQLAALQDVRQAIQNLTKIVICVYSDGRIEPLDNAEFIPDETGYDTTYHSLLKQENCQDLRLCDIKLIARVKAIIDNSVQPIEPLFEDAKLESHYFS